jgi:hypothetical protein
VQTEWSLWSRDIEDDVVATCRELGIGVVTYSPLGRGFRTGRFTSKEDFEDGDFRRRVEPRMADGNLERNFAIAEALNATVMVSTSPSSPSSPSTGRSGLAPLGEPPMRRGSEGRVALAEGRVALAHAARATRAGHGHRRSIAPATRSRGP